LSKEYLRGGMDDVALHTPQGFTDRSIELKRGVEVDQIDLVNHCVSAGDTRYGYAAVVLACGATPTPLPVTGGEGALQLRSLADAGRLRKAVADAAAR
jgi:3-phenylpropionate/trans-cinnamate dioxygenase ferredoxin reductase subunit